jgi:8-oxo-dGTP pyrophosphatase MutT (NUDIX family)
VRPRSRLTNARRIVKQQKNIMTATAVADLPARRVVSTVLLLTPVDAGAPVWSDKLGLPMLPHAVLAVDAATGVCDFPSGEVGEDQPLEEAAAQACDERFGAGVWRHGAGETRVLGREGDTAFVAQVRRVASVSPADREAGGSGGTCAGLAWVPLEYERMWPHRAYRGMGSKMIRRINADHASADSCAMSRLLWELAPGAVPAPYTAASRSSAPRPTHVYGLMLFRDTASDRLTHAVFVSDYANGLVKMPGGRMEPCDGGDEMAAMQREFLEETGMGFDGGELAVKARYTSARGSSTVVYALVVDGPPPAAAPAALHLGETGGVLFMRLDPSDRESLPHVTRRMSREAFYPSWPRHITLVQIWKVLQPLLGSASGPPPAWMNPRCVGAIRYEKSSELEVQRCKQ